MAAIKTVNTEHACLVAINDKIITSLSADPMVVAESLFARGMIPQGLLESMQQSGSKTKKEKAAELMGEVLKKVENFPENFDVFVRVVQKELWLKDLVELIQKTQSKLKAKGDEKKAILDLQFEVQRPDSESGRGDADLPLSPDIVNKFPYLNTPTLSHKKRERLLARLSVDSDEMRRKWALLTDRTRILLKKQEIKCQDLKMLMKYPFNKHLKLFESEMSLDDLFLKLYDHLSFFDHEFIIRQYCPELNADLDTYISDLKEYCKRRVVEVPADVFKEEDADETSLFVKCDKSFETVILEDIFNLQSRLSKLLEMELFLVRVDDGCTQLVFEAMGPVHSLTKSQKDELAEMGVLKLHSLHYKSNKLSLSSPDSQPRHKSKHTVSSETELSASEINLISEEVHQLNKVVELAEALEMTSYLERVNGDARKLLLQWQKQETTTDFLQRPNLMYHLARIGMQDLHMKLVCSEVSPQRVLGTHEEWIEENISLKKELEEQTSSHQEGIRVKEIEIQKLQDEIKYLRNSTQREISRVQSDLIQSNTLCEETSKANYQLREELRRSNSSREEIERTNLQLRGELRSSVRSPISTVHEDRKSRERVSYPTFDCKLHIDCMFSSLTLPGAASSSSLPSSSCMFGDFEVATF